MSILVAFNLSILDAFNLSILDAFNLSILDAFNLSILDAFNLSILETNLVHVQVSICRHICFLFQALHKTEFTEIILKGINNFIVLSEINYIGSYFQPKVRALTIQFPVNENYAFT